MELPAPLLKALAYKQSMWNVNNGNSDQTSIFSSPKYSKI
jgi:hypothetical protein